MSSQESLHKSSYDAQNEDVNHCRFTNLTCLENFSKSKRRKEESSLTPKASWTCSLRAPSSQSTNCRTRCSSQKKSRIISRKLRLVKKRLPFSRNTEIQLPSNSLTVRKSSRRWRSSDRMTSSSFRIKSSEIWTKTTITPSQRMELSMCIQKSEETDTHVTHFHCYVF